MDNKPWTGAPVAKIDPISQLRAKYQELSPEDWTKERDRLLIKWRAEAAALATAKADEAATRIQIVTLLFDPDNKEGTETLEIGNGYAVKAQKKQNYTLGNSRDDPQFSAVDKALDAIEALKAEIPEASLIAQRLVRWKPELSITEYRMLGERPKIKALIDEVLTIKPGTPSLELIEPKTEGTKKGKR